MDAPTAVNEPLLPHATRERRANHDDDDSEAPVDSASPQETELQVIQLGSRRGEDALQLDEAKSSEAESSSSTARPPTTASQQQRGPKKKERFGIGGLPPPPEVPQNRRVNFHRLISLAKQESHTLIWATVCLFLSSILNLALPAIVAVIIDAISVGAPSNSGDDPSTAPGESSHGALYRALSKLGFGDSPRALLNAATVVLLFIILIANIFSMIRGYLFSLAGERIVANMRKSLFSKLTTFEIGFYDVTRTGELINRLSSDSTILKDAATTNISMGLRWAATVVIGICYLFVISWSLTLVMLSVVPLVAIGARYYGRKIRMLSKSTQDALADATTTAEESISAIRTIRSFGKEEYAASVYAGKIDVTFELGRGIAKQYGIFIGVLGFLASLAMVIVLYYGSILVLRGDLTPGILTAFVLYTLTVGMALAGLSGLFASFMQALGACERIFELLDRQPSLGVDPAHPPVYASDASTYAIQSNGVSQRSGRVPAVPRGEVKLTNVYFSYPSRPEAPVLKGLNLTLKPGTVTALVGPSGQGKSTIVSLIERFYDIDSRAGSSITLDGVDIREIDLHWLHRHVGLISQAPILFATSIRENLLYGVDDMVSDERLMAACDMANASEFIRQFPDGLDTMVGERGVRLSGGQMQRIAIARALLMNPLLLIADEATSNLDSESEHLVQLALERLMAHRTTLIIAHRLSTVQNAHNVCVVSGGGIAEQGTHMELLERGGIYARLVRRQLSQPLQHAQHQQFDEPPAESSSHSLS